MSPFAKVLFIIGSFLMLVGSFLPWRREGDVVSYWTHGIQFYPSIKDNGGLLVVLLTLLLIVLIFRPDDIPVSRRNWSIVLAFIPLLVAFFHIGKLVFDRRSAIGFVGAPVIQLGLLMVLVGSLLLLISVAMYYLKSQT